MSLVYTKVSEQNKTDFLVMAFSHAFSDIYPRLSTFSQMVMTVKLSSMNLKRIFAVYI